MEIFTAKKKYYSNTVKIIFYLLHKKTESIKD